MLNEFRLKILLCLLLGICPVLIIQIGYSQQTRSSFELTDAFRILEENNLAIKQMENSIADSELEIYIQKTGYLPTLATTASYNHVSELSELVIPFQFPGLSLPAIEAGVKNQYDFAVIAKQPLFTGFRTQNLIQAAGEQHRANKIQKDILRNRLYLQVAQLYFGVQLNLLQQKVLEQSVNRTDLQLQKVKQFLHAQQATFFDTLEVSNRKLQISNQLQKLKKIKDIIVSKLLFLLNIKKIPQLQITDFDEQNLYLKELEFYQNKALSKRPELNQATALTDAQNYRVKVVRSAYFPQVYASVSYHYSRPGVNFFKDEWMDYYTVGLNLQWEMWNWHKTKQKTEQARYMVRQLDLKTREIMESIGQEIREAYINLLTTKEQIFLQQKLVNMEKERYRITEKRYDQGLATSFDLRDAEKKLTEAELLIQNTFIEWQSYTLQLDYATGVIGKK